MGVGRNEIVSAFQIILQPWAHEVSPLLRGRPRGKSEREMMRTGREIGTRRARESQGAGPPSPPGTIRKATVCQWFSASCLLGQNLPPWLCDCRFSSKPSRPFFALWADSAAGWGDKGRRQGRPGEGAGPRAQCPSQPGASGTELGRAADKAPPSPSPTAPFHKGGDGGPEEEEEEGSVEGAGGDGRGQGWRGSAAGRTGQDRAEKGGEGGGARRPRRTGRREGFLEPKINKLFLFTCGVGGGGEGGEQALWPLLFPSPKPALCHGAPARAPSESPRRPGPHSWRRRLPDPECA